MDEVVKEGRSLADTPTWSVATVVSTFVAVGFIIQRIISLLRKWLTKNRKKALLAALKAIMEEMMVFGVLSMLLGHWTLWISRICIKEKVVNTHFYPCFEEVVSSLAHSVNQSNFRETERENFCPEGLEPFVSHESLEQLHRFLLVLGIMHISYSVFLVTVAMIKIDSWQTWEGQAVSNVNQNLQESVLDDEETSVSKDKSTSFSQHSSQTWSENKVLVYMVCFFRQLWGTINKEDYMVLRSSFIKNHGLHVSYDLHKFMLRNMDDEFRDIVGISVPLWGYAIIFILLNVHGSEAYFWLAFIPAALILIVGSKMQYIIMQLARELGDENSHKDNWLKGHDELLFWFGRPELMLWTIRLISFQNAFEMATVLWSLWEIKTMSCFMKNQVFAVIRLTFGILLQLWCSYSTFPLYIITAQMGSRYKRILITNSVKESLHKWQERAKFNLLRKNLNALLLNGSSNASWRAMDDDEVEEATRNLHMKYIRVESPYISSYVALSGTNIE